MARINKRDAKNVEIEELTDEKFQGLQYILDLFRPQKVALQSLIHGYAWFVHNAAILIIIAIIYIYIYLYVCIIPASY